MFSFCWQTPTLARTPLARLKSSSALCISGSFSASRLATRDLLPLGMCFIDIVDSNVINPTCHEGTDAFLKCCPYCQVIQLDQTCTQSLKLEIYLREKKIFIHLFEDFIYLIYFSIYLLLTEFYIDSQTAFIKSDIRLIIRWLIISFLTSLFSTNFNFFEKT